MMKKYFVCFCTLIYSVTFAQVPADFVLPVKVEVANAPVPSITIEWPANADAINYTIKRKTITSTSYKDVFTTIATVANDNGAVTNYTDNNIERAVMYEYEVSGSFTASLPNIKSTYVCAGTDVPAVHSRGTILLLCDSNIVNDISTNLSLLYADLVGDGWKVLRIDVSGSNNPHDAAWIKAKIQAAYNATPDLTQVFILGHVPVPYSGNIGPDGHSNHIGAWPADGYYGAMNSTWTDLISSTPNPLFRPETKNIPGDGKFDQDSLPEVQLAVGRVDLSNLPVFSIFESDLLNRYLEKDHAFRHAQIILQRRALIEDNFPSFTEKFSQSAWKSFASTVGYDNVQVGQYETWLQWPFGFLWSYGCGAGTFTGASGIGNSGEFVIHANNTIFTQLFGSYFGDWDSQDNYMRSSIASRGNALACVWGGRPHWYFHNMSAGMPIGYSALLTMNNKNVYKNAGANNANVHIALMGDPSLRSSYIKPPQAFFAQTNQQRIDLLWTRPDEDNVIGYYLYRSNSITGNFIRLNEDPITDLRFSDTMPHSGNNVYMVRTVKMDTIVTAGNFTNNSTYANLSQGLFDSAFISVVLPVHNIQLKGTASNCSALLTWTVSGENGLKEYKLQYSNDGRLFNTATVITTAGSGNAGAKDYSYAAAANNKNNFYRLQMINSDGSFTYSNIVNVSVDCFKNKIAVYPNPVNDILNVSAFFEKGKATAILFDATGKMLMQQKIVSGSNTIATHNLVHGVYTLKVVVNGESQYFKIKK